MTGELDESAKGRLATVKMMISRFEAQCAEVGHYWADSPLGGQYCRACGAMRQIGVGKDRGE